MSTRPTAFVVFAFAAAALTQSGYEGPTTFKASEILPEALRKGPHFRVKEEVPTTGYFHDFKIASDFGDLEAEGRSLLLTRIHEIDALARLQEVSKSEVFVKAAGNSVLKIGRSVADVIVDPWGHREGDRRRVEAFRHEPRTQGEASRRLCGRRS